MIVEVILKSKWKEWACVLSNVSEPENATNSWKEKEIATTMHLHTKQLKVRHTLLSKINEGLWSGSSFISIGQYRIHVVYFIHLQGTVLWHSSRSAFSILKVTLDFFMWKFSLDYRWISDRNWNQNKQAYFI